MNIRPLSDNLLVEASKLEEATRSGIVLPDTANKERPEQGKVIAVGPGKTFEGKLIPMNIKIGDKILFKKYGPDEIKLDGKEYLILSESDVLAVIE
ncbi:MAG: co-chaperone GroES [bacterium]